MQRRQLIISGDGSYSNRAVLTGLPERTTYKGVSAKDAKLHYPLAASDDKAAVGRPCRYGPVAPTPDGF